MGPRVDHAAWVEAPPTDELRYQQYWEEMPCYLTLHDRDFRIIDGNRMFREHFGDRVGSFCYQTYKRREEVCPDCPVEATFEDGLSHGSEQLLTTLDGASVSVMVRTTPIRDADGEVVAVMEMHTDISDLKRLQVELQSSQERLAQLFSEVPCFITVQGRDRVIRHANRMFVETFGEAEGVSCFRVYKHRDEQCLVCPMEQTFADGLSREHEEVLTSRTGEKLNVLCTTAPLRSAGGEVEAVIEMGTDITQIRQLQSQLTSIGLLVGSISHGIKGLLTGLDGGIYLVNSGFEKDRQERVRRGWDMVQRNVDRIRTMVLDILYYAKDRDLQLEPIEIAKLVEDLRQGLVKKASDIDVEIEIDVHPRAGSFQGDLHAIRTMLLNLLENSLDACRVHQTRSNHRIRLSVRRARPWMEIEVEDTGIGMDRETREKVFSLFFSSKGIKGTGLGLFISNKIVDKHGGAIDVASEPGKGTRFLVRLPLEARPGTRPDEGSN